MTTHFIASGQLTLNPRTLLALDPRSTSPLGSADVVTNALRLTMPASFFNNKLSFVQAAGALQSDGTTTVNPQDDGEFSSDTLTITNTEIANQQNVVGLTDMHITPIIAAHILFKQQLEAALNGVQRSLIDFSNFLNETISKSDVVAAIQNGSGQIVISNVNGQLRQAITQDEFNRSNGNIKMSAGFQSGDIIHVEASATSGFSIGFQLAQFTDPNSGVFDHTFAAVDTTNLTTAQLAAGFTSASNLNITITLTDDP